MIQSLVRVLFVSLFAVSLISFSALSSRGQNAGETLFKSKCAACHGPDGKGETSIGKTNKIRDLSSANVQQESDADLTGIITTGKGKMPAYGKSLKPDQVKELVTYMRSLAKK